MDDPIGQLFIVLIVLVGAIASPIVAYLLIKSFCIHIARAIRKDAKRNP